MTRRRTRLALATTCSDRKAAVASGLVRLRDVSHGSPRQRARHWGRLLHDAAQFGTTHADRLYLGPHWTASKRAFDAAQEAGFDARMCVVSAGYGLYPVDAMVTSYAATFVPGHEDSVTPEGLSATGRIEYLAGWWAALGEHVAIEGVPGRSFIKLAIDDPDMRLMIVAGGNYLDAITEDLLLARRELRDPDFLAVVSAGASSRALSMLGESVLPVDARFESFLKGARTALNARVAQWLLSEVLDPSKAGASYFRKKLEAKTAELPPLRKYDRAPMTDIEIQFWIAQNAHRPEAASASSLLRRFRDAGLACEQKRFGMMYRTALAKGAGATRGR